MRPPLTPTEHMADAPITFLLFCFFAAFCLFSFGYLVAAWIFTKDKDTDNDC